MNECVFEQEQYFDKAKNMKYNYVISLSFRKLNQYKFYS